MSKPNASQSPLTPTTISLSASHPSCSCSTPSPSSTQSIQVSDDKKEQQRLAPDSVSVAAPVSSYSHSHSQSQQCSHNPAQISCSGSQFRTVKEDENKITSISKNNKKTETNPNPILSISSTGSCSSSSVNSSPSSSSSESVSSNSPTATTTTNTKNSIDSFDEFLRCCFDSDHLKANSTSIINDPNSFYCCEGGSPPGITEPAPNPNSAKELNSMKHQHFHHQGSEFSNLEIPCHDHCFEFCDFDQCCDSAASQTVEASSSLGVNGVFGMSNNGVSSVAPALSSCSAPPLSHSVNSSSVGTPNSQRTTTDNSKGSNSDLCSMGCKTPCGNCEHNHGQVVSQTGVVGCPSHADKSCLGFPEDFSFENYFSRLTQQQHINQFPNNSNQNQMGSNNGGNVAATVSSSGLDVATQNLLNEALSYSPLQPELQQPFDILNATKLSNLRDQLDRKTILNQQTQQQFQQQQQQQKQQQPQQQQTQKSQAPNQQRIPPHHHHYHYHDQVNVRF
ncbi:unnamed protein product [Ambrosiozyma monospora]|uniref:Unnamed protein product n=1 Tax=Ambrosiozyma monospora TaxID=43982 RepID=A0ACB5SY17_AMBMO|nr:unnamed protein product [Ambrosiozyma monospora]